jgi:hypothetical protein
MLHIFAVLFLATNNDFFSLGLETFGKVAVLMDSSTIQMHVVLELIVCSSQVLPPVFSLTLFSG